MRSYKKHILLGVATFAIVMAVGIVVLLLTNDNDALGPEKYEPHAAAVQTLRGEYEVVLEDLEFASGLTTGPDGRIYAPEFRSGNIKVLSPNGSGGFDVDVFATVPLPEDITQEQGLWHVTVDPTGSFLYGTAINETGSEPRSHVFRFPINDDGSAGPMEEVCGGIQASLIHNGGALIFGPDGMLYVSAGEAIKTSSTATVRQLYADNVTVEDFSELTGIIFRMSPDGCLQTPETVQDLVYAMGFRNVYGMTFAPDGTLYATDNGPSCCDRIFRVLEGADHGWPRLGISKDDMANYATDGDVNPPLMFSERQQLGMTQVVYFDGDAYGGELAHSLIYGTYHTAALMRVELTPDGSAAAYEEVVLRLPVQYTDQYVEGGGINGVTIGADGYIYFSSLTKLYRLTNVPPLTP